ncbi:sugar transferase [Streptomyces sp. GC420]|uniref:sugar transferase n=1 Tax=Streptomyces sp. GC420 TaxID=2697568 RepID=UPI001414DDDF|nr:sugar transferase [Streptomyces sp. GC420]NBM16470.1 sugar transferase [Streptomyces sp. GC420]
MPASAVETADHRPTRRSQAGGRAVKRAIDLVGAAVLLLLLAPVLLVAAIAVKADTPGPLLFRQRRTGWRGEEFHVLKLRTMRVGSEGLRTAMAARNEADGHLFKIREDPRVTAAGRWLRRFSLDELPQLVNVLKGQMSLVGPRPLPVEDSAFGGEACRRLLVRPGLTGLWQVSGRSDLGWEDALQLDLEYVDTWSVRLDLKILVRTLPAVLRGDGAY